MARCWGGGLFSFLLFKSSAACKGSSIKTFEGTTLKVAFKSESKDWMTTSKAAGDAPQLCPDGERPKGRLRPDPDLKRRDRATCKRLHLPAVILTQILLGQGQSQRTGLISKAQI